MRNRRNRRTRRTESQSPDRDENTSETSFTRGNATLINVSESVNSQKGNEIEVISQRLAEQNNSKMTQIEEQLNNKFEEILKEIRTNRNYNITTNEEDVERSQPGPSNSKNRSLRTKHASNTT